MLTIAASSRMVVRLRKTADTVMDEARSKIETAEGTSHEKLIAAATTVLILTIGTSALASGYLINTKSGKFHYVTCRTIKNPNAPHFEEVDSREEAIAMGYEPCKICRP